MLFGEGSNGELSSRGLEPMHVAATNFMELSHEEGCLLSILIFL
jgi:hypothetical protein